MPMIELDDEDVALLELAKKVGGAQAIDVGQRAKTLHDTLYSHAEVGADYQRAMKKVYPNTRTTADIAEPYVKPLQEKLEATQKQLDEFIAAQVKAREDGDKASKQASFDAAWAQTVKDHELTEEGQEALIKHMQTVGIADPEAGALHYFHKNPKPAAPVAPSSIAPAGWGRDMGILHDPSDTDAKSLIANPEEWADREAAAVLTDVRRAA